MESARTLGYIYFISEGNDPDCNLKIGFSEQPLRRMGKELQIGNSKQLVLVAQFRGTYAQEQALHKRLDMYATMSNEWYYPVPEIREMVRSIKHTYMYAKETDTTVIGGLISHLASGVFRRSK